MPLKIDRQITILFQRLDSMHRISSFPRRGCLSKVLHDTLGGTQRIRAGGMYKPIRPQYAAFFASAAVEMWLRGVHSFLISAGVYKISPIWSSVCGYYSSHYCVRALAHLLGFFQIRRKRCVAKIEIEAGTVYRCHFNDKAMREHVFYWQVVKESPQFSDNPFLTTNLEYSDESVHRVTANYYDHVNHFPQFCPLDKQELKNRISRIAKTELTAAPVFDKDQFPEVDKVQLIAYHRIIIFRNFLDNILGSNSQYWNYHRTPSWSGDYLNFQVVSVAELENLRR